MRSYPYRTATVAGADSRSNNAFDVRTLCLQVCLCVNVRPVGIDQQRADALLIPNDCTQRK